MAVSSTTPLVSARLRYNEKSFTLLAGEEHGHIIPDNTPYIDRNLDGVTAQTTKFAEHDDLACTRYDSIRIKRAYPDHVRRSRARGRLLGLRMRERDRYLL